MDINNNPTDAPAIIHSDATNNGTNTQSTTTAASLTPSNDHSARTEDIAMNTSTDRIINTGSATSVTNNTNNNTAAPSITTTTATSTNPSTFSASALPSSSTTAPPTGTTSSATNTNTATNTTTVSSTGPSAAELQAQRRAAERAAEQAQIKLWTEQKQKFASDWVELIQCLAHPDPLVIHRALDYLIPVSSHNIIFRETLKSSKIIDRLLFLINRERGIEPFLLQRILECLANVLIDTWQSTTVIKREYYFNTLIEPMYQLLKPPEKPSDKTPELTAIQTQYCLRIVYNITANYKETAKNDLILQLVPVIYTVLSKPHQSDDIKILALACIDSLCENNERGALEFVKVNGVDWLVINLATACAIPDPNMQYSILQVLAGPLILNIPDARKVFLNKNGCKLLVTCLENPSMVGCKSLDVIRRFAHGRMDFQKPLLECGALAIILRMLLHCHKSRFSAGVTRCHLSVLAISYHITPLLAKMKETHPQFDKLVLKHFNDLAHVLCQTISKGQAKDPEDRHGLKSAILALAAMFDSKLPVHNLVTDDVLKALATHLDPKTGNPADDSQLQAFGLFALQVFCFHNPSMQPKVYPLISTMLKIAKTTPVLCTYCFRTIVAIVDGNTQYAEELMKHSQLTGFLLQTIGSQGTADMSMCMQAAAVYHSMYTSCEKDNVETQFKRIYKAIVSNPKLTAGMKSIRDYIGKLRQTKQEAHDSRRQITQQQQHHGQIQNQSQGHSSGSGGHLSMRPMPPPNMNRQLPPGLHMQQSSSQQQQQQQAQRSGGGMTVDPRLMQGQQAVQRVYHPPPMNTHRQ